MHFLIVFLHVLRLQVAFACSYPVWLKKLLAYEKGEMRLGKSFRRWNKLSSCRFGEYGSSSCLVAVLGLGSPVTEGKELTLKLF